MRISIIDVREIDHDMWSFDMVVCHAPHVNQIRCGYTNFSQVELTFLLAPEKAIVFRHGL